MLILDICLFMTLILKEDERFIERIQNTNYFDLIKLSASGNVV